MCNIGNRPTVSGRDKTIEVHLFDFESDIYGETVELSFEKRIRTEQKFESVDALKAQLQKDEIACRQLLNA
jgi:riboflavin kinase/FMN adenylyltransferase